MEKLTPEQEDKLTRDVMRAMLDDASIDPRTKQGIQMAFTRGVPPEMMKMAYQELTKAVREIDPSPTKLYVHFLLRHYAKGAMEFEDILIDLPDYLNRYEKMRQSKQAKPPHNDINTFKDIKQFKMYIDENSKALEEKDMAQGEAETVYEDSNVLIVVPKDIAASCRYGAGTKWCTAAKSSMNEFERYAKVGTLYYLIPKVPKYPKEKYAIHFQTNTFKTDGDVQIDEFELLTERFGNLIAKYFRTTKDYEYWASGKFRGITRIPVQVNGQVFESFNKLFIKDEK